MKNLLLLSNSTLHGQDYLAWCNSTIREFLRAVDTLLFIPYAGVTQNFDDYTSSVAEGIQSPDLEVTGIHQSTDPIAAIKTAKAIAIGGGNTFHLTKLLQENDVLNPIRQQVMDGVPLVGWSAGSVICCQTICTTNDMPISQPESFVGLGLVDFQINAHYTEATLPNHAGESRSQRLTEYLELNPEKTVLCLPEGSYLCIQGDDLTFYGSELTVLRHLEPALTLPDGAAVSDIL